MNHPLTLGAPERVSVWHRELLNGAKHTIWACNNGHNAHVCGSWRSGLEVRR